MSERQKGVVNLLKTSEYYLKLMEILLVIAALKWAASKSLNWLLVLMMSAGYFVLLGYVIYGLLAVTLYLIQFLPEKRTFKVNNTTVFVVGLMALFIIYQLGKALQSVIESLPGG